MNELFAADPAAFSHEQELRLLLRLFGPFAGRYLALYPHDWDRIVANAIDGARPLETERIKTMLRRAREGAALIESGSLGWNLAKSWRENAIRLATPPLSVFQTLIMGGTQADRINGGDAPIVHFDEIDDVPLNAEERIRGEPQEYARAARTLIRISDELAFIDPYLNPSSERIVPVLRELLRVAAERGKVRRIQFWARHAEVTKSNSILELERALRALVRSSGLPSRCGVELLLVRDEDSAVKLHERVVLSIKGGVRFDLGFQRLPQGRKAIAGPISRHVHDELFSLFFEQPSAFHIVSRIRGD